MTARPVGKICSCCHALKPLTAFYVALRCRDGRRGQCKTCHTAGVVRFRRAQRTEIRERWAAVARQAARHRHV